MEIRAIRDEDGEAVAVLWDRMCRETPDGGPLAEQGRRNLARMLAMSSWHRDAFCFVAERDGWLVGFVNGRLSMGDGLLPGLVGEIDSLYIIPGEQHQGVGRRLAETAIGHLRDQGAGVLRQLVCIDAHEAQEFWRDLGFVADMVCMSSYQG